MWSFAFWPFLSFSVIIRTVQDVIKISVVYAFLVIFVGTIGDNYNPILHKSNFSTCKHFMGFTFENLTQYHLIKYVRGEIKKLHFLATKKIVNGFKEYFCLRNKINVPGLIQIYFVLNVISYTKIILLKISPK